MQLELSKERDVPAQLNQISTDIAQRKNYITPESVVENVMTMIMNKFEYRKEIIQANK